MPDQTLAQMVRAKYPGVYDDLSDAALDTKVRAKYPGVYDDLAKPAETSAPTSQIGPAFKNTALPPDTLGQPDLLGPKARAAINTPLAHTGLSLLDNLTTPASLVATLVGGGLAAKEAQAAGVAAKAFAGMRGMLSSAAPQIKYEIIKSTLTAVHVPAPIAMGLALAISGKGGAKGATAAETLLPEGVDPHMPNVSGTAPGFGESASGVAGPVIDRYAPNVSGATPSPSPAAATASPPATSTIASDPAATLAAKLRTPGDLELVQALVGKGNSAAAAVKTVARGDPKKFGALMTAYMQARQVKP